MTVEVHITRKQAVLIKKAIERHLDDFKDSDNPEHGHWKFEFYFDKSYAGNIRVWSGRHGISIDDIVKSETHYEVYEVLTYETQSLESFDYLEEALGFLFTLREVYKKRNFCADKWIGHGLNVQIEDVFEEAVIK